MNLCFFTGKIETDIKFKFIINNKNISIATFKIKLNNNSSINVKAYNEMADWCYQKLVKNDLVTIQGRLDNKMEIIIEDCNYL